MRYLKLIRSTKSRYWVSYKIKAKLIEVLTTDMCRQVAYEM